MSACTAPKNGHKPGSHAERACPRCSPHRTSGAIDVTIPVTPPAGPASRWSDDQAHKFQAAPDAPIVPRDAWLNSASWGGEGAEMVSRVLWESDLTNDVSPDTFIVMNLDYVVQAAGDSRARVAVDMKVSLYGDDANALDVVVASGFMRSDEMDADDVESWVLDRRGESARIEMAVNLMHEMRALNGVDSALAAGVYPDNDPALDLLRGPGGRTDPNLTAESPDVALALQMHPNP